MANPPQGPKNDAGEALPGPSQPLLRLAKVTQKRGFCRRFPGGSTAVFRQHASPGSTPSRLRPLPFIRKKLSEIPYTLSRLQTQHSAFPKVCS